MKKLMQIGKAVQTKIFTDRMFLYFLIVLVIFWKYEEPYINYVKQVGYPISWCIFPFVMTSSPILITVYFCVIYMNADIPFMQHINMYYMIRAGRKRWAVGQIGGIAVRSSAAVAIAAICSLIPFIGRTEWSPGWGKVMTTLALERPLDSDFYQQYASTSDKTIMFKPYQEVISSFTPVQLMLLTVTICTLIFFMIGLAMFLLGLTIGRIWAVSLSYAYVMAIYIVENMSFERKWVLGWFLPTIWAEVGSVSKPFGGYYRLPSPAYMFTVLIIAIAGLTTGICLVIRRVDLNWDNEDA